MTRSATLLVLALLPGLLGADVTAKVTLDRKGSGKVFMILSSDLASAKRLQGLSDPRLKDLFLARALAASPAELTELLLARGFVAPVVDQKVEGTTVRTEVSAGIGDLRPLSALAGGELSFGEKPGNYLELGGTFGGALAGQDADLTPFAAVRVVKLWIVFPGTVREADGAEVSHTADSTVWRRSADKLLAEAVPVKVSVLPRIEGEPNYWLALILGVTALVVVGAAIVLRHGRQAKL